MEKFYVVELMRITKWIRGGILGHPKTSCFDSIDDAKKWIKENIYIDMRELHGSWMHLLIVSIESDESTEVVRWHRYAHSNENYEAGKWHPYEYSDDVSAHARYKFSITERCA